ncbi:radical SAM protein [Streptomyces aidingensis]|uniref:Radical SAM superfamily protein n=1 Tax=Streptomyces aidingensis TaxID=910347 RepID=A0A1I1H0F9_9ACTN|nr:radical SAM protein [Streptomyces aidingensis]SFC17255.1 Radical SAM superfamily protein [Streptomyces aidingensis]
MRLGDLIALRPEPAAGLLATLTRRCPLSCAHCSTSSGPRGEDTPAAALLRFAGGFTPAGRPEVMMLTGGEPLLRPALVRELAALVRPAGTRTALLSGMFFARDGRIPRPVMRAVAAVDHFSASIDIFHEREIPRRDTFRALHRIMDAGLPVSIHATGSGPDDPYLAGLIAAVSDEFTGRVPMLVNTVRPAGRAAAWAAPAHAARLRPPPAGPAPCAMAAWPVIAFDGTVVACCNQRAVDRRPVPAHLRLGHIADDTWPDIRRRCVESGVLRMIRTAGPARLLAPFAAPPSPGGACAACHALAGRPDALAAARRDGTRPAAALLDRESARLQRAAGPAALLRRYGCAPYAHLVQSPHGAAP